MKDRGSAGHVHVEAIIPVHRADRPLLRCVQSLRLGTSVSHRITIVCHNIRPDQLVDHEVLSGISQVRFLECHDPSPSPSGPRNLGLNEANATWLALVDSDDYVQPGALQTWLRIGNDLSVDAVVPRHVRSSGALVRTPVVRPYSTILDPVKDRLPYRVGHLGLVRQSAVRQYSLKYSEGMKVGEDLEFSTKLWFSGARIAYARHAPAYVVNDAGPDHATGILHSVEEEVAGVTRLIASPEYLRLSHAQRHCVDTKLVRGSILPVARRLATTSIDDLPWVENVEGVRELREVLGRVVSANPSVLSDLSVADARLVSILEMKGRTGDGLVASDADRSSLAMVLPDRPSGWVSRQGPLRFAVASALMRIGRNPTFKGLFRPRSGSPKKSFGRD